MKKLLLLSIALFSYLSFAPVFHFPPNNVSLNSANVSMNVGDRPFREGGIRLELDPTVTTSGTRIIHNYGHGGAGITLSWGTAKEAVRLADRLLIKTKEEGKEVIVLGNGVIGLTTAFLLLEKGYKVRVYTKDLNPHTTSNVAGGLWSPVSVDFDKSNPEEIKRWLDIQIDSYREFQKRIGEEWHVHPMMLFATNDAKKKSGILAFNEMPDLFSPVYYPKLPIEGVNKPGIGVETFLIEPPPYLKKLNKIVKEQAKITQQTFKDVAEIRKQFPNQVVFNCMGLGAGEVMGDKKVTPIHGNLVYVESTPNHPIDFEQTNFMVFYSDEDGNGSDYMFPHKKTRRIVYGGSFKEGSYTKADDLMECHRILRSAQRFHLSPQ